MNVTRRCAFDEVPLGACTGNHSLVSGVNRSSDGAEGLPGSERRDRCLKGYSFCARSLGPGSSSRIGITKFSRARFSVRPRGPFGSVLEAR